jgi:hypothetical protein
MQPFLSALAEDRNFVFPSFFGDLSIFHGLQMLSLPRLMPFN